MYKIGDIVYIHTEGLNKTNFIGLNITRFGKIYNIVSDDVYEIEVKYTGKIIKIDLSDGINAFVFSDINELIDMIRNSDLNENQKNMSMECIDLVVQNIDKDTEEYKSIMLKIHI